MRLTAFVLSLALAACASTPHTKDDPIRALTAQAERWDQAIVAKDRAGVEANMAADFRHIDGRGSVATRAAFVANILSDRLAIDPYRVEGQDVRVYDDVALLSGTTHLSGRWDGKPFTTHYRYTDTYARENGAWKVVSVQITEIVE